MEGPALLNRRLTLVAALALAAVGPATALAQRAPRIPAPIAAALASPERTEAMKARDAGRKPGEIFALAGLKPGDRVIELASTAHYDSTIIANVVGPKGRLYMYDLPYLKARMEPGALAFVKAHPNTEYVNGKFDELTFPSGVDLVMIDMYYHDLPINDVDTAVLNRKLFAALKPGGRLVIVDHNAEPGSGKRDVRTLHRIDPEVIKSEVQAAGFRLAVDSRIFAMPTDDKSKRMQEPGTRGFTDRSVFVFRKPG